MWSVWAAEEFGSSALLKLTYSFAFDTHIPPRCLGDLDRSCVISPHPPLSPLFLFLYPSPRPLSLALISNKDEGVALIDIVANESFSSVSLTSQIPGQCVSLHIPLPAGFSLVRPACCRLASQSLCCRCCQPASTCSAPAIPRAPSPDVWRHVPAGAERGWGGRGRLHLPLSWVNAFVQLSSYLASHTGQVAVESVPVIPVFISWSVLYLISVVCWE